MVLLANFSEEENNAPFVLAKCMVCGTKFNVTREEYVENWKRTGKNILFADMCQICGHYDCIVLFPGEFGFINEI